MTFDDARAFQRPGWEAWGGGGAANNQLGWEIHRAQEVENVENVLWVTAALCGLRASTVAKGKKQKQ